MVVPSLGEVVTVYFPFSDLTKSKLRPALVLVDVENDDWILAQITSKSYADVRAISLAKKDFTRGMLNMESYIRPGKLFTANSSIFHSVEGSLSVEKFSEVVGEIVQLFNDSIEVK